MLSDPKLPDRRLGRPRRDEIHENLSIPSRPCRLRAELFFHGVEDQSPVTGSELLQIRYHISGESELVHAYIIAYADPEQSRSRFL